MNLKVKNLAVVFGAAALVAFALICSYYLTDDSLTNN